MGGREMKTCDTCKWFAESSCRLKAPSPAVERKTFAINPSKNINVGQPILIKEETVYFTRAWPRVAPNDFCGEWEAR